LITCFFLVDDEEEWQIENAISGVARTGEARAPYWDCGLPAAARVEFARRLMINGPAILLVDDDANDIELTFEAFRKAGFENPIFVVRNKQEAIDYLRGGRQYANCDSHRLRIS
jgi:hypothetical protein